MCARQRSNDARFAKLEILGPVPPARGDLAHDRKNGNRDDMTSETPPNRLDRPVDETYDHIVGPADAEITLVEYGSYADPSSRAAHERVMAMRERLGGRFRYVFRHRPLPGSDIARRAAERVESYSDPERFWSVHVALMALS
ncbi:MAG: DsbA family protein, partial [Nitrosospira sp.]|nr:DsbA family protein [Nitrosospira sp.]